jgi:hypothetical protein
MISFGVQIDSRKEKVLRPCRGMYIVFEKRGKVLFSFPSSLVGSGRQIIDF